MRHGVVVNIPSVSILTSIHFSILSLSLSSFLLLPPDMDLIIDAGFFFNLCVYVCVCIPLV